MRNFKIYNRYYSAVLYPSDENYDKYFSNIMDNYTEVTYILHNKDTNENGELKKEHIHILFRIGKNPRNINTIAEEIDIPIQYLERMQ